MDDYNLWSDLLDTWQSTADWIKALAILTPQATALAALALVLRHRLARRRAAALPAGTLAYTIWRDDDDRLHVVRHELEATLTAPGARVGTADLRQNRTGVGKGTNAEDDRSQPQSARVFTVSGSPS